MGDSECILSLEVLCNMYEIVTSNLHIACSKRDKNTPHLLVTLKPGDTVMIKNHMAGTFESKYIGDFRIVTIKGHQVELMPSHSRKTKMEHISHIKYALPAEHCISKLPDYSQFGRKNKLWLNPDYIPDLKWGESAKKPITTTAEAKNYTVYVSVITELMCNNDTYTIPIQSLKSPIYSVKPFSKQTTHRTAMLVS